MPSQTSSVGAPAVAAHAAWPPSAQATTPSARQAPWPTLQASPTPKPSSTAPSQSLSAPSQVSVAPVSSTRPLQSLSRPSQDSALGAPGAASQVAVPSGRQAIVPVAPHDPTPLVHAAPGLLGHRLLERNITVGDARWRRRDYPRWWFIVANHRMTFERLTGRTPPG
jgi:hypothetical protein